MSTVQGLRSGMMAGILVGMTLAAGTVSAQGFSTERPGSILIFPKVVNTTGGQNSIIQISNTSNGLTHAHCFYTDGRTVNGRPTWQVTDFELILTRQQPTHWGVAQGRQVNPFDSTPGLDPGLIPPVPPGFTGFLVCVETAVDGTPVSANSLKGEATIGVINDVGESNNASKYSAVAIPACSDPPGACGGPGAGNDGDNVLSLNNLEYAACPGGLYLNFTAEGSGDPAIDSATNTPSIVSTNLTLVPCGMDFENLVPPTTTLSIPIRNEFEENLSAFPVPVDCWFSDSLGGPILGPFSFSLGDLGTTFGKAIVRPLAGNPPLLPVLGVANVLRTAGDLTSDTAAMNLPFCTEESPPSSCVPVDSEIRLPSF